MEARDVPPPDRPESFRGTPTIKDLARVAGVSIGTASKALNGAGRMRQETRDRVLAAAREIGYRPNDLAHSLRRARSRTIGIISNDSFGRFTIPIVEALEERLADLITGVVVQGPVRRICS
jgi:LacI family transcriptional regulator